MCPLSLSSSCTIDVIKHETLCCVLFCFCSHRDADIVSLGLTVFAALMGDSGAAAGEPLESYRATNESTGVPELSPLGRQGVRQCGVVSHHITSHDCRAELLDGLCRVLWRCFAFRFRPRSCSDSARVLSFCFAAFFLSDIVAWTPLLGT